MRLICGESISVAVCPSAAAIMTASRRLLFHLRMFSCNRHYFCPRIYQTALAGDQADDGADQDSPISDPDPAHQREYIRLEHRAFAVVGRAREVQVEIFVQAAANRYVRCGLAGGEVQAALRPQRAEVRAALGDTDVQNIPGIVFVLA